MRAVRPHVSEPLKRKCEFSTRNNRSCALHASCEDYRAAATIDLIHDEAGFEKRIECPLLVLWGGKGFVHRTYDVLATWKEKALDVRGGPIDCGHFLPEEKPEAVCEELIQFFSLF